jgi:hypothetical protein
MARTLFRVSTLVAATAIAGGTFALSNAAPRRVGSTPGPSSASDQTFAVAALNRRASGDDLANDAAAAGETGLARPGQYAPPAEDPIAPLLDGAPEDRSYAQGYDQPYPDEPDVRTEPYLAGRPSPALRHHHRVQHHHRTQVAQPAPHPAAQAARPSAPAPAAHPTVVRPHRMRIILEPQRKPSLTSPSDDQPALAQNLPSVEAEPQADLDAQLAELTRAASADMQGIKVELAPQLSAGREGAVVLTLPPQLLSDLTYRAEDSDPNAKAMTITIRLSGEGWRVAPDGAQTVNVTAGRPATFTWRASPSGPAQGSMIAEMRASLDLQGQPVTLPLGTLALQLPPPVLAPTPVQAASAPAPEPDEGITLPDLSNLSWNTLAIPGHPTVQVPGLGEVASGKVVGAGLLLLILLFLRELLHRPIERRQRRRAVRELEAARFGDGFA